MRKTKINNTTRPKKKLEDARKKGEVAKSVDLSTAAGYAGLILTAFAFGSGSIASLGTMFEVLISRSFELGPAFFGGGQPLAAGLLLETSKSIIPWFAIPALAVLASVLAQQAFVVAPDKLVPKNLSHFATLECKKTSSAEAACLNSPKAQ